MNGKCKEEQISISVQERFILICGVQLQLWTGQRQYGILMQSQDTLFIHGLLLWIDAQRKIGCSNGVFKSTQLVTSVMRNMNPKTICILTMPSDIISGQWWPQDRGSRPSDHGTRRSCICICNHCLVQNPIDSSSYSPGKQCSIGCGTSRMGDSTQTSFDRLIQSSPCLIAKSGIRSTILEDQAPTYPPWWCRDGLTTRRHRLSVSGSPPPQKIHHFPLCWYWFLVTSHLTRTFWSQQLQESSIVRFLGLAQNCG